MQDDNYKDHKGQKSIILINVIVVRTWTTIQNPLLIEVETIYNDLSKSFTIVKYQDVPDVHPIV